MEKRVTDIENALPDLLPSQNVRSGSDPGHERRAEESAGLTETDRSGSLRNRNKAPGIAASSKTEKALLHEGQGADVPEVGGNARHKSVPPSRNTRVRVGDTTTSFTELPTGKRTSHSAIKTSRKTSDKGECVAECELKRKHILLFVEIESFFIYRVYLFRSI